jgi:D-glycero-alpha-D-manno-heptose-7-phosphate kinase
MRISFAGGGTDLPAFFRVAGGEVLSATIDRYITVAATDRPDTLEPAVHEDRDDLTTRLADAAARRLGGIGLTGPAMRSWSDVAPGSGLGGSSALAVAVVGAVAAHTGAGLSRQRLAETGLLVERTDLGLQGGWQDHFSAAFGGFNHMHFSAAGARIERLAVSPDTVRRLAARLMLCRTGITRSSMFVIDDQVQRIADGGSAMQALLRQKELVAKMRVAIEEERLDDVGDLLHIGWTEKRRSSPLVSLEVIDQAYQTARRNGARGGKVCGAGRGGYLLLYCEPHDRPRLAQAMGRFGWPLERVGLGTPGLRVWRSANPAEPTPAEPT